MKSFVFVALSLFASVVSAFHIVPPSSIKACEPLTVEYDTTTGQPPFSLSFHTGSAEGPIAAAFTDVNGTSYTWPMVTTPAGTNVVIILGDSSGLGSATPVITVSPGSSDVCLNNPTSIPVLPSVTSTSPPTSTFNASSIPPPPSTTPASSGLSSSPSPPVSIADSQGTTTTPRPTATGGLSTSGGVVSSVDFFNIGAITAIIGVILV